MKKRMIAAAIVCAAAFANAATYDWTITGYATPNGEDGGELTGAKIYGFDANVYTIGQIVGQLTDTEIGAAALDNALNFGTIDDGAFYEAMGSGLTDDGAAPANVEMFAVIVAKDADGKDWFYTAAIDPIEVTEAITGGGAIFEPDVIMTGAIGGTGWAEVAPEPTSGLLLLIGVAGLALKLKRA